MKYKSTNYTIIIITIIITTITITIIEISLLWSHNKEYIYVYACQR